MNKTPYEIIESKYNEIDDYLKPVKNKYPDVVNDMLFYYVRDNIHLFSEIKNGSKGVYFIEDFYIGRTKNIYNRITSHIIEIFQNTYSNQEKVENIKIVLKERKLKVNIISDQETDEKKLIIEYSKKYNLTNIEFNPNKEFEYKQKQKKEKKKKDVIDEDFIDNSSSLKNAYNKYLNNININVKEERWLIILTNNITNRVGVYSQKSKSSFLSNFDRIYTLSKNLLKDFQEYGISSFNIQFIKCDNVEDKWTFINYFNENKIELYVKTNSKYKEINKNLLNKLDL